MKALSTLILLFFFLENGFASGNNGRDSLPSEGSQLVSLVLHKSFDAFERSHFGGIGAEYALSNGRFTQESRGSRFGWVAKAGADYFPGRKDPVEGYAFRYYSYFYGHLMGGLVYLPAPFANVIVAAGPGAGLYHGYVSFGLHGTAAVNIFVDPRFTVGPSVTWRKQRDVDGLWTGALRVGYIF